MLEVKRVSNKIVKIKMEVKGKLVYILHACFASGVQLERKRTCLRALDKLMQSITKRERVMVGADSHGQVVKEKLRDYRGDGGTQNQVEG